MDAARRLFVVLGRHRRVITTQAKATIPSIRLFDLLPDHPIVTLPSAMRLLDTTKPTAAKAIDVLRRAGILEEITGQQRDRFYAYRSYLKILAEETELPGGHRQRRGPRLRRRRRRNENGS